MPKSSTGPGRRTSGGTSSRKRPLGPKPQRVPTQAKSPGRLRLERYSIRPLHFFQRLPRFILPIVMAALLLAGLLVPSALAGFFLLVLGAFLAWLLALSWPALAQSSRLIRLAVVVVVLFAACWRFAGYG